MRSSQSQVALVLLLVLICAAREAHGAAEPVPPTAVGAVVLLTPAAADARIDELAGLLADEMLRFTERLSLVPRAVADGKDRDRAAELLCGERARAVVSIDFRQTEARLTVLVCSTGEMLERWAPYAPEDPDRGVTLAHLTAALLRAGLSSGPPQVGHEDHIKAPPEPAPGDYLEEPQGAGRSGPESRESAASSGQDPELSKPRPGDTEPDPAVEEPQDPVARSIVEFDAHFSTGNLVQGDVVVGGGLGAAISIIDELAIRLDLTVYSAVTKEKATHFAELYSVPLILGLCYRPAIDRFRVRVCAEGSLNMASIRSGPLKSGQGTRRYDLKLNPGLGGGAGARFYILPYVFTELFLSGRYYLTAQRYTVEGRTLIKVPRHDLEARVGVGISF